MTEPLIERSEVVALLFTVSDIAVTLDAIRRLLQGRKMVKKKLTEAEREAQKAEHERVLANAQRLRELAEKGLAKLEAQQQQQSAG